MTTAEQINATRWDKFTNEPRFDELKDLINSVIDAAGLDRSDCGLTWGITVHVDRDTFLRVNYADYALFDIRDPEKDFNERRVCIALVPGQKVGIIKRWIRALRGLNPRSKPGFTKLVPESHVMWTTLDKALKLVEFDDVRLGIRQHVEARHRASILANRHNPLTEALLD